MSPLESTFNDEIEFAQRMQRDARPLYWRGYVAGSMRALFDEKAVSDRQHLAWLDPGNVEDAAVGYRDGYAQVSGSL